MLLFVSLFILGALSNPCPDAFTGTVDPELPECHDAFTGTVDPECVLEPGLNTMGGATIRAIITNHYFADCQGVKAYGQCPLMNWINNAMSDTEKACVTCCADVEPSNVQCIRRYSDSACQNEMAMFQFQPIPQQIVDECIPMPQAMPPHPTKGADHRYRNTLRNQVYCSKNDETGMCEECNLQGDHNDGANPTPGSHNLNQCVSLNGAGSYMKVACSRRKL